MHDGTSVETSPKSAPVLIFSSLQLQPQLPIKIKIKVVSLCVGVDAIAKMSMFRSKKLDLGCFVNIKVIRDHTKRKVFAEHEPERYVVPISTPVSRLRARYYINERL